MSGVSPEPPVREEDIPEVPDQRESNPELVGERPVHGGTADADDLGDLRDGVCLGVVELSCGGELGLGHHLRLTAALAAAAAGGVESGGGAFPDDLAFEIAQTWPGVTRAT